jgi:hypothetical protein
MNEEVIREVYAAQYMDQMSEDKFRSLLSHGLQLLSQISETDKLFVSRFFKGDDLKAVNIALLYNQELMIKLLAQ